VRPNASLNRARPVPTSHVSLIEAATAEVLVAGKVEAIGKFFSEDYVAHVTEHDVRGGHELIRAVMDMYRAAFSDLTAEVRVFVESSDTVAWQRTMRARHTGAFKGSLEQGALSCGTRW
jgi:uncharacterized protein (AIM24 family)